MTANPTSFFKINVTDTCAVWNLLSSKILFCAALSANCTFCITGFVYYECLLKQRSAYSNEDLELQTRLKKAIEKGNIVRYGLDIADLQEIEVLERRRNLGKGELSSIAYAKKIDKAIMTDDQKARRLAENILDQGKVQTTPKLLGWLFFSGILVDHQKDEIIREHRAMSRPLSRHFIAMYETGLQYRLISY